MSDGVYCENGIVNQIKHHIGNAPDVDWLELNDFWEGAFASELSSNNKSIIIGMVNPQPGIGGGHVLRRRRLRKKYAKWGRAVDRASMHRFLYGGGLVGMSKRGEYP